MYYIQELISLVGDIEGITKDEIFVLNEFTDEKVGLKRGTGKDYSNNNELRSAFHKIKKCGKMAQYLKLVMDYLGANIDDFYAKMDSEL